ncbi:MAG: omptin family outer membrane protease [Spirochaetota bacterium]
MYDNSIHRLIFIFFCTAIIFVNVYSVSYAGNMHLDTIAGAGFLQGTIGEYVYENNRTLSRLNWNISNLLYYHYSLRLQYEYLFAGIQVQGGINDTIGTIDDSDWVDENNPTVKTHYSKHDNYLEKYTTCNCDIGFESRINDTISLKPCIGFLYKSIKMSARDGYVEYPPGSPKVPVYGIGIIYEQRYYIPYIAFEGKLNLHDWWAITAGVAISLCAQASDIDNHVKRDLDFYDDFNGVLYLKSDIGIQYSFHQNIKISVRGIYEYVPEQKGDMYYIDTSTGAKSNTFSDTAGISMSLLSFECLVIFKMDF